MGGGGKPPLGSEGQEDQRLRRKEGSGVEQERILRGSKKKSDALCNEFKLLAMSEKIARSIDVAIEKKCPFILISKSGGARMMEAGISLMQMAKATAKLTQLAHEKLLYISYLTDPTTGGVTASFAMLGDVNVAEPGALIGFAGPRVIKETIGKDLPEGFQTSEFLLEKGFLDFIIDRRELKSKLSQIIKLFKN